MGEEQYEKDSEGNYIIAENVPFVFNSILIPITEEGTKTEVPNDANPKD